MERTWTELGDEFIAGDDVLLEDGEVLTRSHIEAAINTLDWRMTKGVTRVAAMPGMAIQACITELNIPKVSLFAISSELAPYGFYGIEGNYKNGRARVYVIDRGAMLTVIASDFWEKEEVEVDGRT